MLSDLDKTQICYEYTMVGFLVILETFECE